MDYKDYYSILGIKKSANADEIKKAYRKLTGKYHPDKNPGDKKAEEKFKDISEAHDVLSNPENRKMYDELGSNWKQYKDSGTHQGSAQDFSKWYSGGRQSGQQQHYSGDEFGGSGFSDFFENVFGGRGGGNRGNGGARRGQDLQATIELSLDDAYTGVTKTIQLESGPLNLKLKPGIADGQTLKLKGKGAAGKAGAGDLYIGIRIQPGSRYERRGNDLYFDLPVDAISAITGGKAEVRTPGKNISITIPEGTETGKIFRLKDMGMPVYDQPGTFGAAYAKVVLTLPKNISAAQRNALKDIFQKNISHA